MKAAGQNIVAVILQHELPHLSHLGVRARQVSFVSSLKCVLTPAIRLTGEGMPVGEGGIYHL